MRRPARVSPGDATSRGSRAAVCAPRPPRASPRRRRRGSSARDDADACGSVTRRSTTRRQLSGASCK
eukprot:24215-Pelagococcus_subviridis.AAC.1